MTRLLLAASLTASLAACTTDEGFVEVPGPSSLPAVALPAVVDLDASPLLPGQPASIVVRGAPPGATVRLAVSSTGEGAGPCHAPSGACLEVLNPSYFAMRQVGADYVLRGTFPAGATGRRWLQAAVVFQGQLALTDVVQRVVGDADLDRFAPPADCDDSTPTTYPGAPERLDNVDNDCDGVVDELDPHPDWMDAGGGLWQYDILAGTFATDCPPNPFGAAATVEGIDFAVYDNGSTLVGLIGGSTVPAPTTAGVWNNAYLMMTGGRCTDEALTVTWNYTDGTTAGGSIVVPWDCVDVDPAGGTNATGRSQGSLGVGGCCPNWHWLAFDNPVPGATVASARFDYADGCGGAYPGQIWALSAD